MSRRAGAKLLHLSVSPALHEAVLHSAELDSRSVTQQVEILLTEALLYRAVSA